MAAEVLRFFKALTATIANGASTSSAVDGRYFGWFGLVIPAAFTGTSLTYVVSQDGVTYQPLYNSSGATQITTAVVQGRSYDAPAELTSWAFWKIVSNAAEGGARTIQIVAKG